MKTNIVNSELINKYFENPKLKELIIDFFNGKEFTDERIEIAKSTNDFSIIEILSADENEKVRAYLAENTGCSEYVLDLLSNDINWEVRANVAKNPNASIHILERLRNDDDAAARVNVMDNPKWIKLRKT